MSLRWIPFAHCWICFYFYTLMCVFGPCYPAQQITRQQDSTAVLPAPSPLTLPAGGVASFKAFNTQKSIFLQKKNPFLSGT